jgi:hypothetical protein
MRKCPFCGSKNIQIDPDAAMDTFALCQGPDGGVIMLDGNAKAVQWADLNHCELHYCHECTAEFDALDTPRGEEKTG